jgi:GNAT superfamily N-acetyltransferase
MKSREFDDQPEIIIRAATLDDIEPSVVMRGQSWIDTYPNKEHGVDEKAIRDLVASFSTPEKIAKRKQILLDSRESGKGETYVAVDAQGKVVGAATPYIDDNDVRHVGSLYTDASVHGVKGANGLSVGGKLMQRVMEFLDAEHHDVVLSVAVYNERAKAFYRKWGFVEVAGSENVFDPEAPIPEIDMVRKGGKI